MNPLLEVRDLRVEFPGAEKPIEAVCGAAYSVPAGSFTALVGASGSGKTLSALAVCRLTEGAKLSGRILLEGNDLLSLDAEAMRRVRGKSISYVFQDPSAALNPVMRCGDQVAETHAIHIGGGQAEARRAAREMLARVGLEPERAYRSYPHELSGGMKQRVAIAAALVAGPKLLIADEPTTALDASTEVAILELLETLRRERSLTLLFITHDLALAQRYADGIVVMEKGRVVESESAARLFRANFLGVRPKTPIPL